MQFTYGSSVVRINMPDHPSLRAELTGPGPHHLGQLTWKYGFSSQGQMSRAFRALFGHAPRDTQPGEPAPAWGRAGTDDLSFSEILRQLQ